MPSMVACVKCKTVVWAYDHSDERLGGIANMWGLPCPECGGIRCFDGWSIETNKYDWYKLSILTELSPRDGGPVEMASHEVLELDGWSWLREVAKRNGLAWRPDSENRWPILGVTKHL